MKKQRPKQGWRNYIKYIIWIIWLSAVIFCYFQHGKIVKIDFLFETENGISVSSIQSYIIYYGIVCLIFIPSALCGKRVFCHYFCWMAPFMVLGTKLRKLLHLPGIRIKAKEKDKCITCRKCYKGCPMGINVVNEIKNDVINNLECIQCGACIDSCPKQILSYGISKRKGDNNGK